MADDDKNIRSLINLHYVNPKYADLPDFNLLEFESSTIWKDENLRSKERVKMVRIMSLRDEEVRSNIINSAVDCLCKSASQFSVGCLIIAAWNLISPQDSTKYVFEVNEIDDPTCEVDVSELSATVRAKAPEEAVCCNLPTNPGKKLKAVAYLAASALRMMTKSSESYIRAYGSIKSAYQKFYGEAFPGEIVLNPSCVDRTKFLLDQSETLKNSAIPFLYSFHGLSGSNKGICRKLFEQYLEYNGLHAYSLFETASDKLGLPKAGLMELLQEQRSECGGYALKVMEKILDEYDENPGEENRRRTWKYARLFDQTRFEQLRTKTYASDLVTVLAHLNQMVDSEGSRDVMGINHIRKEEKYRTCARRIYEAAMSDPRGGGRKRKALVISED